MKIINSIQSKVDHISSSSSSSQQQQSLNHETDEIKSLRQALMAVAELAKTAKLIASQERLKYEEKIYELEKRLHEHGNDNRDTSKATSAAGGDSYNDSTRDLQH